MGKINPIGRRFAEERKRLGYTQSEFAELGGLVRRTIGMWESGSGSPSADFLAIIAERGADVYYIVTGLRQKDADLPPREKILLDNYRHSDESDRRIIDRMLSAFTEQVACHETRKKAGGE